MNVLETGLSALLLRVIRPSYIRRRKASKELGKKKKKVIKSSLKPWLAWCVSCMHKSFRSLLQMSLPPPLYVAQMYRVLYKEMEEENFTWKFCVGGSSQAWLSKATSLNKSFSVFTRTLRPPAVKLWKWTMSQREAWRDFYLFTCSSSALSVLCRESHVWWISSSINLALDVSCQFIWPTK